MKKTLIILINLFVSVLYAQQSAICTYKLLYKKENYQITKNDNAIEKNTKQLLLKALNEAKNYNFILKFNKNECSSKIDDNMASDYNGDKYISSIAKALIGTGLYYQNKTNNLSLWETNVMGSYFIVTDSLKNNWIVTQETKKIGKYTCYRAVKGCTSCKSTEEVWFTPEIPEPFGPKYYGGLPGLIVSVHQKGYDLQLVSIKYVNKPLTIEKPKKGKRIARAEYDMITSRTRSNAKKMSN